MNNVTVVGAGLAGAEAAWQAAQRGAQVVLYEMRPVRQTPLITLNSLRNWSVQTRFVRQVSQMQSDC
ncbi:hypothetical protein GCM10025858_34930 [Alicyclobacillus sacchari]|nr:hypothetical protein GCM10025858_34930 [Alicyclobacillus sacchari]